MNNDLGELKPLGEPSNKANLNSNAPAEQNQAGALEKGNTKKDYSVPIFFVLVALFIGFVIYNMISTRIYLRKVAEKRAAFQKAYAEQQKQIAAEQKKQERFIPQTQDGFYVDPPVEQQNRPSSTDLLMQAASAERQAQQQTETLDYGAQVAAYEEQVKAQQQAAQQRTQQPQTVNMPRTQQQARPAVQTTAKPAAQKTEESGTKINKLETRRIFK